jgi:hypothetical protein
MGAKAAVCIQYIEGVMDLKRVYQCNCRVNTVIDRDIHIHTFNWFGIFVECLWK